MSLTATMLKGFQLVMPDGRRHDLNFDTPAPFKEKDGFSILSIELEHLEWDLRVIVQISHLDGSVAKECVGTHKETGAKHEFIFMPFFEGRVTNLNRRPVGQ